MKGLQTSTIMELAVVALFGFMGGITQNFGVIIVGGIISLIMAAPLYSKIESSRSSTTSFEKQGSAIAAFFLVVVVYFVFYFIGGVITLW